MSYVYIESEKWREGSVVHRLYTVGFYKPDGKFEPESDHEDKGAAADRVAWLNGGLPFHALEAIKDAAVWHLEKGA